MLFHPRLNLRNRWLCAACAVALSVSAPGALAQEGAEPAPPEFVHHFFNQPIPLQLDPTRIAVLQRPGARRAPAVDTLENAGLAREGVEPWPIEGWSVAGVGAQRADGGDETIALVGRLAADAGVDFASPVFVGLDGGPIIITPQILVQFEPEVTIAQAHAILDAAGAGVVVEHEWAGMERAFRVESAARNGLDVLAVANALAQRDDVIFAEPDMIFTGSPAVTPGDPLFTDQWAHKNTGQFGGVPGMDMKTTSAWDLEPGDPGVVVVAIDNGVQQSHPDLSLFPGDNFTNDAGVNGGPFNSCDNHGTAVAGCVSAVLNNSLGVVGSAPGCRVASARVMIATTDCTGNWTSQASWTVDALTWAQTIGARVTNNSNGYGFTSSSIASKYASTQSAGIVHFASSMNSGVSVVGYPASLSTVLAVGSIDPSGARSTFSNYGPDLDFMAPGSSIRTTDRTGASGYSSGDYTLIQGTSFSSPYAAGVAALMVSAYPGITPAQINEDLRATASDLGSPGFDQQFGYGLVNALAAVEAAIARIPLPPCMGDITGDGTVNTADLGGMLGSFGTNGPYADVNQDGVVNTSDLGLLLIEFGRTDCD
jgi:subtilisin family serine protease